jgi:hypothetical protein
VFHIDVLERDMFWLNVTNGVLGALTFLFMLAIVYSLAQEILDRVRQRRRVHR